MKLRLVTRATAQPPELREGVEGQETAPISSDVGTIAVSALVVGPTEVADPLCSILRSAGHKTSWRRTVVFGEEFELLVLCCDGEAAWGQQIEYQRSSGNTQAIILVGHDRPCRLCDSALDRGADLWIPATLLTAQFPRVVNPLVRRVRGRWRGSLPGLDLSPGCHTVRYGDVELRLRPKEFALLAYLVSNEGRWSSERRILEEAFGTCPRYETPVVRVHVRSLRKALGALAPCVESRRGCGYRFVHKVPHSFRSFPASAEL